jgi:hypothetical protein
MPMLPDAPGLFSITTGWPSLSLSTSARTRNSTSVEPPAGYGTITRIWRSGQLFCARAGTAPIAAAAAAPRSRVRRVTEWRCTFISQTSRILPGV